MHTYPMANAYEDERSRPERNSETVFVRMKPSTRALLEQEAEREGKALSEAARGLLEKALETKPQEAAA